jgi:hypothetical protein
MRPRRRRSRGLRAATIGTFILVATGLAGCFTTTADFTNDAETFIETDEGLRDTLRAEGRLDADASFATATCAEPANQDVDTTFACTATDTTGAVWDFEIVITGSNEYEVNLSRAPDGS